MRPGAAIHPCGGLPRGRDHPLDLFGLPAKAKISHIPWATYTDPELAQVGLTEAQAREKHGDRLEVVRFEYHENDRAIAEGKTTGLIKVMVVKGRPVGASSSARRRAR